MEKKPNPMAIILFLTGLICIALLFGISYKTYLKIDSTDKKMDEILKPVEEKQKSMKEDVDLYTAKIEAKQESVVTETVMDTSAIDNYVSDLSSDAQ